MSEKETNIRNTVMFTVATNGYVPFVLNLDASLQRVGLDGQLAVYSLDDEAHRELLSAGLASSRYSGVESSGWSDYGTRSFATTMSSKYQVALELLGAGHNVLYVDSDTVFLRNPVDHLRQVIAESSAHLFCQWEASKDVYNAGFWFATPSPEVMDLFRAMVPALDTPEFTCDQALLNERLRDNPGLRVDRLDPELFACGNQFLEGMSPGSIGYVDRSSSPFPMESAYLLHFNYLIGKEQKVLAMIKHGAVFHPSVSSLRYAPRAVPKRIVRWLKNIA